jgi:hypothetical protein
VVAVVLVVVQGVAALPPQLRLVLEAQEAHPEIPVLLALQALMPFQMVVLVVVLVVVLEELLLTARHHHQTHLQRAVVAVVAVEYYRVLVGLAGLALLVLAVQGGAQIMPVQ